MRTKNPLRLFVLALVIYAYSPLSYSALSRLFWLRVAETLVVVSLTWLCLNLINLLMERTEKRWRSTPSSGRIAIGRLLGQVGKGLAIIAGAAIILYHAGVNLTAVLTGLGVGGIAIAFAAQKTLENLFGGVMIVSDQPIRVGDFCRFGEYSGIVEAIGLRSTRIRTMDRTIVSVPNGQLAAMSIENFAPRDKIKFSHTIELHYDTSGDQLTKVIEAIKRLLDGAEKVEQGARVRLISAKNASFQIEIFAYVLTSDWNDFLEIQEKLLLSVINIVEHNGAGLSAPVSTYVQVGAGSEGTAIRANARNVRKNRPQEGLFNG